MRILSGIQPSGALHIGNYFGMMKPALELAGKGNAYYFIADYHALTSLGDPATLRQNVQKVALDFLACGLDPARTIFFRQSDVPEVTELSWILSCVTPVGLLERCHAYKEKIAKGLTANHGLFAYPVLMAADILIYQSDLVPIGEDQRQHLEVARDIAIKFNHQFGPIFKIPEGQIREEVASVPGIDGQKMSKSYGNTIEIFADEKTMKKKFMSIVTDSLPMEAPKNPEGHILFDLYKLFASQQEAKTLAQRFRQGGVGYAEVKKMIFEKCWEYFAPYRQCRSELERRPGEIERVLQDGALRARTEAKKTLIAARKAVGLE